MEQAGVTVRFQATDDDAGSGIDGSTLTPDVTISDETAGTTVHGSAQDLAGNLGTDEVVVKLDMTAPSITGDPTTTPNGAGWYDGPVTVHFECSDTLSDVAECTSDTTLTENGAGQPVTGEAKDFAGNQASTVEGINIDATAPSLSVSGIANGAIYTLGDIPGSGCSPGWPSGRRRRS